MSGKKEQTAIYVIRWVIMKQSQILFTQWTLECKIGPR